MVRLRVSSGNRSCLWRSVGIACKCHGGIWQLRLVVYLRAQSDMQDMGCPPI